MFLYYTHAHTRMSLLAGLNAIKKENLREPKLEALDYYSMHSLRVTAVACVHGAWTQAGKEIGRILNEKAAAANHGSRYC